MPVYDHACVQEIEPFNCFRITMGNYLYEIWPSPKEKKSPRLLGFISAFFALLLLAFILWAAINGKIGTWTIVILSFPVLFLALVSRFAFKVENNLEAGIIATEEGIGITVASGLMGDLIKYQDIDMIEFEENLELHRTGKRIRRFNVYRVRVQKKGQASKELLAEMIDLLPEQILKFRHFPDFLIKNGLIPRERMDTSKLP